MGMPRVIIADTEINYIVPIQMKFAMEFFNRMEIEIITDKTYFNELFCKPQKVDILIISEEFFDNSLMKHEINNIFLMQESENEVENSIGNITYINKYSSIKEIFNKIVGKALKELQTDTGKQGSKIVVVTSPIGGAGKTTISVGMCGCLAKEYKNVLYLNASRLQAEQYMFTDNSVLNQMNVYTGLLKSNMDVYRCLKEYIRNEIFNYVPPLKSSLISLGIDCSIFQRIATDAKASGEYDYIVVDTEGVLDENLINLLNVADSVIVVVKQNVNSRKCLRRFLSSINNTDSTKYIFVCNDYDNTKENAFITLDKKERLDISEYVEHNENFDEFRITEYLMINGIKKISYLFD